MNCEEVEKEIYLYRELTAAERKLVDAHIQTCAACEELLQVVLSAQTLIAESALRKPELANHSRLTSNIMQAIQSKPQKESGFVALLRQSFVKYSFVAASLVLVVAFGVEQLSPVESYSKRIPETNTVTLNSSAFMKAALERKEKPEAAKASLYACAKSGNCDNTFIESFKKKSL
jgi:hypothetical protein